MTVAIVALVALVGFAVYLWLIAPNKGARARMRGLLDADCAHRGLHGEFPENSLPAYDAAANHGYGIELDVRPTKDKRLVLSHDDDVSRMCGVPGKISQMTLAQVRALRLLGTDQRVPTFEEALATIAGRVPVIVEMKSDGRTHGELPPLVIEAMKTYRGAYAVESFDPLMLRVYRKLSPQTPRGQLASKRKVSSHRALAFVLSRCLLNFLSRPDFIAYEWDQGGTLSFALLSRAFKTPTVAWTVSDKQAYLALKERYDIQIFEHFAPNIERNELP